MAKQKRFIPKGKREVYEDVREILKEQGQERLLEETAEGSGAFCVLPYDAVYESQNKDEIIVFIIRAAVVTLIPKILQIFLMILLPIFLIVFLSSLDADQIAANGGAILGLVIFWYLFTLTLAYRFYLHWYYNVFIITNQRVIDIDYNAILESDVSGTSIKNIEDISIDQTNVFGNIFGFGNINIQTAGAKREFELENVPKTTIIQDAILDLKLGSGN